MLTHECTNRVKLRDIDMTRIVFSTMELSHIHNYLEEICVAGSLSGTSYRSLDLASDPIDDSCDTIVDGIAEIIVVVD
jgi:hypothetical protein